MTRDGKRMFGAVGLGVAISLERKWRARVDAVVTEPYRQVTALALFLPSQYLSVRMRLMRRAARRGFWLADGLNVTFALVLDEGDVVFDVGANVGWVTERAAWLVGAKGQVHAFEPSARVRSLLERRVTLFRLRNVVVNGFAAGAEEGEATLYEFDENFGGASSMRQEAWPGHQAARNTPIHVVPLDKYVEQQGIASVRLMKVDVQGAEADVLSGAGRLLNSSNAPLLFVELERDATAAFGRTIDQLLAVITAANYEMYSWRPEGFVRVQSSADMHMSGHDDIICFKQNSELHQADLARFRTLATR